MYIDLDKQSLSGLASGGTEYDSGYDPMDLWKQEDIGLIPVGKDTPINITDLPTFESPNLLPIQKVVLKKTVQPASECVSYDGVWTVGGIALGLIALSLLAKK